MARVGVRTFLAEPGGPGQCCAALLFCRRVYATGGVWIQELPPKGRQAKRRPARQVSNSWLQFAVIAEFGELAVAGKISDEITRGITILHLQ